MAKELSDLEALEIVAALTSHCGLNEREQQAVRAVILLAGTAIAQNWRLELDKSEQDN